MRHLLPSGPSGLCCLLQSGKGGGAGLTRAFAQNPAAKGSSGAFLYRRKCADAQASPMPPPRECKTDDFNFHQAFYLLQQGRKFRDCKRRNKLSTLSPETVFPSSEEVCIQISLSMEGFGSRLLTCCRNGTEFGRHFPIQTRPMELEPPYW